MFWSNTTINICLTTLIALIFITIGICRSIGEALFILTIIILSHIKLNKSWKKK